MGKARVAVALVAAVAALTTLLNIFALYFPGTCYPISRYESEFPKGSQSVVKLSLGSPTGSDGWQCVFAANESSLLYMCWGYRYWIEIALGNGTVLVVGKLWDTPIEVELNNETITYLSNGTYVIGNIKINFRKPSPTVFYSATEVADLINKRAYAVEEARTDEVWFGLERYVRVIENTTFDYKWVELSEDLYANWTWVLTYIGNITFKVYLAFMDYVLGEEVGVLKYRPTPVEVAEKYLKYATETYSKLLREVGVNVVFELVDPDSECDYPKTARALEVLYSAIACGKHSGVNVLGVVRAPYLPNRMMGAYIPSMKLMFIRDGYDSISPHVFVHELGHALSLVDIGEGLDLSKAVLTLYTSSVMYSGSSGTSFSVGDLAILLLNAYRYVKSYGSKSDAEILRAKLTDLGIDPENASMLLPLTPQEELPPCFRSLLGVPILKIDPINPENSILNYHVIQAITKTARIARSSSG